ncbi:MAG: hypothetical protein DIJKHBIC_04166 [Thermoanaerobaculia bacterium]|nr:hypothetical protein [Thermoanaerobaculia bacterium]
MSKLEKEGPKSRPTAKKAETRSPKQPPEKSAVPSPILPPGEDIDAAIENAKALEAGLLEDLREASPEDLAAIALEIQAAGHRTKALEERKRSIAESSEWMALLERHSALFRALTVKEALIIHYLRSCSRAFHEASALVGGLRQVTDESKLLGRAIPSPDPVRGNYGGLNYGQRLSAIAFGRDSHRSHGITFFLPDPSFEA